MLDTTEPSQVYTGEVLAFLKTLMAGQKAGYLQVEAIAPETVEGAEPVTERQTVAVADIDRLEAFIEEHHDWNLTASPHLLNAQGGIAQVIGYRITLLPKDPPADATVKEKDEHLRQERKRLHQLIGACPLFPTFIIDTGYGYQGLWDAIAPVSADVAEAINQRLATYFKVPATSVHQPLRLPHTTYHPGYAEQRKGWGEGLIRVTENYNNYAPEDFDVLTAGPPLDLGSVDIADLADKLATPKAQMDQDYKRLMDGKDDPIWLTDKTQEGRDVALARVLSRFDCTPDGIGLCVSNFKHGATARHDDPGYITEVVRQVCPPKKPGLPDTNQPLCESLSAFMADRKPQEVLIEGILYKGDHNAAMGHPNAGKTTGMLDLCLRMIFSLDLPNRQVVPCRIVYLATEDADGFRRRIRLWCQTHGKKIEDAEQWLSVIRRPVLDNPQQVAKLLVELEAIKPELIVVDTFSANYGGESEDKATEVKKWMAMIRQDLIVRFNCCVVTLHHPPKGATDIHNWRGSGVAAGDLDNIFCFRNLGENHIRMDQADGRAKHRTAQFDPLTWQTETAVVDGWFNSLGKPETSVRATLVSDYKVEPAVRVCRAIQVLSENSGKPSHAAIAELAGVATGSMDSLLKKMKTKGGLANFPGKVLVTQKDDGSLQLSKTGKETASMAMVDLAMTRRIEALKGACDDEEGDDEAE